jgi:MFS superfamily sulfate permease-like transporter
VDVQSIETLSVIADELSALGIRIHVVEARSKVRDRIRRAGMDEKLGGINRFSTIADVLDNQSA